MLKITQNLYHRFRNEISVWLKRNHSKITFLLCSIKHVINVYVFRFSNRLCVEKAKSTAWQMLYKKYALLRQNTLSTILMLYICRFSYLHKNVRCILVFHYLHLHMKGTRLLEVGYYIVWNVVDALHHNLSYILSTKTNLTIELEMGLRRTRTITQ